MADLDEVDDTARQEREEQRQRLQRKLADTVRNRTTSCGRPKTPIRPTPSPKGCGSYYVLATDRQALLATIAELDSQDAREPERPNADQLDLLDALPHLTINLHRASDELLDHLFDLTQLTIQVHYATNEATLKVTLPADDVINVAEIGQTVKEACPCRRSNAVNALVKACATCTRRPVQAGR